MRASSNTERDDVMGLLKEMTCSDLSIKQPQVPVKSGQNVPHRLRCLLGEVAPEVGVVDLLVQTTDKDLRRRRNKESQRRTGRKSECVRTSPHVMRERDIVYSSATEASTTQNLTSSRRYQWRKANASIETLPLAIIWSESARE